MIQISAGFFVKEKSSFENKVIPYIYGRGIHAKINQHKFIKLRDGFKINLKIEGKSISALVAATTGMLRYSKGSQLKNILVHENSSEKRQFGKIKLPTPFIGAIIKPSLKFNQKKIWFIINRAKTYGLNFIKDDDASEYTRSQVKRIFKIAKNLIYFQKINNMDDAIGKYCMIAPWIDGWQLLDKAARSKICISHCAGLSPQISWQSQIMFSRLAGAQLIIVPAPDFDSTFDLKEAINTARKKIPKIPATRIIISGGITPAKINKILAEIPKTTHQYVGFAIGSWLIDH